MKRFVQTIVRIVTMCPDGVQGVCVIQLSVFLPASCLPSFDTATTPMSLSIDSLMQSAAESPCPTPVFSPQTVAYNSSLIPFSSLLFVYQSIVSHRIVQPTPTSCPHINVPQHQNCMLRLSQQARSPSNLGAAHE